MPEEDAVRAYLKHPGKKTTLTVGQQVLAMDKLLEDAESKLPHDLRHGALPEHEGSGDGPDSVDESPAASFVSGRTQNE